MGGDTWSLEVIWRKLVRYQSSLGKFRHRNVGSLLALITDFHPLPFPDEIEEVEDYVSGYRTDIERGLINHAERWDFTLAEKREMAYSMLGWEDTSSIVVISDDLIKAVGLVKLRNKAERQSRQWLREG